MSHNTTKTNGGTSKQQPTQSIHHPYYPMNSGTQSYSSSSASSSNSSAPTASSSNENEPGGTDQ